MRAAAKHKGGRTRRILASGLAFGTALALGVAGPASAATIVTAAGQNGWKIPFGLTTNGGTGTFGTAPAGNPAGDGALQIVTPASNSKWQIFGPAGNLADISAITSLSYAIYNQSGVPATLQIKLQCGTLSSAYLVWEFAYNGGAQPGQWAQPDLINGGASKWWLSGNKPCGTTTGNNERFVTWDTFKTELAGVKVTGIGVSQGSGTPDADSYVSSVTLNGAVTDFEDPSAVEPEIPPTPPATAEGKVDTINGQPVTDTPPSLTAGSDVTLTGSGFLPNGQVVVVLYQEGSEPINLGVVEADAEGNVSATVTLPADAAGSYQLALVGDNGQGEPTGSATLITVTAGEQPPPDEVGPDSNPGPGTGGTGTGGTGTGGTGTGGTGTGGTTGGGTTTTPGGAPAGEGAPGEGSLNLGLLAIGGALAAAGAVYLRRTRGEQ